MLFYSILLLTRLLHIHSYISNENSNLAASVTKFDSSSSQCVKQDSNCMQLPTKSDLRREYLNENAILLTTVTNSASLSE